MKRRSLVLLVRMTVALGGAAALLGPAPDAAARSRLVHKTVPYTNMICTEHDAAGYCAAHFYWDVNTTGVLKLAFVADSGLCAPVEVLFRIREGDTTRDVGPFPAAPGGSTGVANAGPASTRKPGIFVLVRDVPDGGCDGPIAGWSGKLKVTTSQRARR